MEQHILFYSNIVAIWHGFPDINHIKVIYWTQVGHFEFDQVEIFHGISLKPHILFYSNGLAISYDFPDITHVY